MEEQMMRIRSKIFAVSAVVLASASSGAMAQYLCSPVYPPGYGTVTGEASGAAAGYSAAGPVGAVVGGALGIAAGTLSGTVNMLKPSGCPYGYYYYGGACYPAR
jgi:hypothetical protein